MITIDDKDKTLHREECGKCTNCKCMNNEKFLKNDSKLNIDRPHEHKQDIIKSEFKKLISK